MKKLKTLFAALALCAPLTAAAQDIEINAENFPDENFRHYLLEQDYGADGVLTEAEIQGVTRIELFDLHINSLKGIEYFTALTHLNCWRNQLTELDVSKNTALTELDCGDNRLTALDVSKNTALTKLECTPNELTALDVSNNTALTVLSCNHNQLTALDVSKNTALTELWCGYNQLTALNMSKNTALTKLWCLSNQLTTLDVSGCTALTELTCAINQLTTLDLSKNTALTGVECSENQLTALDVSGCTALTYIYCYNNQIKGEAMDAFISSLPIVSSSRLHIFYNEASDGNVVTDSQVAAAKTKGWIVYKVDDSGGFWSEYDVVPEQVIVSIGEDGLTTYCSYYGADFSGSTGIAAYKASVSDNTVTLTRIETMAAGEGALLRSINGGAVRELLPTVKTTENPDNAFVGLGVSTTLGQEAFGNEFTVFVLSKVNGVIGFFKANDTYLEAGKAVLLVENNHAARGLTITFDDDTTGISEVAPVQPADDAFYTLDGVRVTAPAKGLYIKNGKKVFVK